MEALRQIGKKAFSNCKSLLSVNIPYKTETIKEYAFDGGSSLESVNFYNNSSLQKVCDYAFKNCIALCNIKFHFLQQLVKVFLMGVPKSMKLNLIMTNRNGNKELFSPFESGI